MSKQNAFEAMRREKNRRQSVVPRKGASTITEGSPPSCLRFDNCILLSTDSKGLIGRVNAFGQAFLGKHEGDILGRGFSQIVLPDDFEFDRRKRRFIDHFLYTPDKSGMAEFETRHASSRSRRVAWTRSPVRDPEGNLVEMLYLGIDVQQTVENAPETLPSDETEIGEAVSNYSVIERFVATGRTWAWEVNAEAVFRYVSSGVEALAGYSPEEIVGTRFDCLLSPKGAGLFRQLIDAAPNTGNPHFQFEDQIRCKNGKQVWTEIVGGLIYSESNRFSGARGLIRDIRAEASERERLAFKTQEYEYQFDNMQVVLMLLDEGGVILNINQAGAKMLGRANEKMKGRKLFEFVPESERSMAIAAFTKTYQNVRARQENFVDIEPHVMRMETSRGNRYFRIVPKAVKVMENDRMVGILNTAVEITESHMIQKELERHKLQLQQLVNERKEEIETLQEEMLRNERLTTLGRLTSIVSHEIRNPLGTINSSLYVVNERLKGKDLGVGRAIERGFRAIRRCDGIIEEMLDFTRTKGLEKRQLEISSWLEKLLDEMRLPGNVSIAKMIDTGMAAAIDPGRLQRCISNILENSLLALRGDSEGLIRVSAQRNGDGLEISIRDNGPGIPKKMQKSVFDPLFSTKQNGIGMGLPVCKQVMELHGGSISLRSNEGRGTTVILRLPGVQQP